MNTRKYFSTALLQTHKLILEQFLLGRLDDEEQIDIETADQLAEDAALLASRLTVRWENYMAWHQANDDNPESDALRENSTVDLCQPFTLSPNTCPDCGGHHDDDGGGDHTHPKTPPHTTVFFNGNKNLVQ
jgi:hypothetical protein